MTPNHQTTLVAIDIENADFGMLGVMHGVSVLVVEDGVIRIIDGSTCTITGGELSSLLQGLVQDGCNPQKLGTLELQASPYERARIAPAGRQKAQWKSERNRYKP